MLTRRILATTGTLLVTGLAAAGIAAEARTSGQPAGATDSRAPIYALAQVSAVDADQLDAHAAAMERVAIAQPAHARWSGDAEQVRKDARALRFVASSALAIAGDRGSNPDTAVEVRRVLGDGLNLQQLGRVLTREAEATRMHLDAMRRDAAGDSALVALVDASAPDVAAMQRDGEAAVARGVALEQLAEGIAQNTGQPLPGP